MVKPAAAPVENSTFNFLLATKEALLYDWKSVNGLSRAKCRDQSWYLLQARGGCAVDLGAAGTAEEARAVNCTVCALCSYSWASAAITESAITSCAKRLFFLQDTTPTSSAVGRFSELISDLQISST